MDDQLWVLKESDEYMAEFGDPDDWYSARVRWDGCIEYIRHFNVPGGESAGQPGITDQVHICDIGREIERLQALKLAAENHFGDWPR